MDQDFQRMPAYCVAADNFEVQSQPEAKDWSKEELPAR
jgi:hypothetical protein